MSINAETRERLVKFLLDGQALPKAEQLAEKRPMIEPAPQGLNGPLTETEREIYDMIKKLAA